MIRSRQNVEAEFTGLGDNVSLDDLRPIAQIALDDFISGRVDAVSVVFPRFVNTLTQVPEVRQILPIVRPESEGQYRDYIFEPSPEAVLESLLPRFVEIQIYQAMLESIASEHSARMVAMRNASQNAKDLVSDLTLTYNKARQAQITREVSEIAAGAEAMKS
jgi:F-type H+-transporting ATPase subunit gamma